MSSVTQGLFSAWSSSRHDGQPYHGIVKSLLCWWMLIQLFIEVYSMSNKGLRQGVQCLFCRNAQRRGQGADRGSMHEPQAVTIHKPIHTEDKLSRTTGELQLPAFGEGTERKHGYWLTFKFLLSTMDQDPGRLTIDGDEQQKQDTASAVERDRSPHPKSLYLQSTDACTASFFLSILCQKSWFKESNVLVLGQMPSEEKFSHLLACKACARKRHLYFAPPWLLP